MELAINNERSQSGKSSPGNSFMLHFISSFQMGPTSGCYICNLEIPELVKLSSEYNDTEWYNKVTQVFQVDCIQYYVVMRYATLKKYNEGSSNSVKKVHA